MENRDPLEWLQDLATKKICTQKVELDVCSQKNIEWDILRTDLIHPTCSGNKFFKLKYYLSDALKQHKETIATFGGPWSNHLVATAFAANYCGLKSIGFVRGDTHDHPSPTILNCMEQGMEIRYINRERYDEKKYDEQFNDNVMLIPQGGFGPKGVEGATEMLQYAKAATYTHIVCAVGSGTMFAGLCLSGLPHANIMGLVVHKDDQIKCEIEHLLNSSITSRNNIFNTSPLVLLDDHEHFPNIKMHEMHSMNLYHDHAGGFAKANPDVISFMNWFHQNTMIPTDFVYTGRLMKWIFDSIKDGKFPAGSRILAIHSGGLQGNISLKKQSLVF